MQLQRVASQLHAGNVGMAIAEMETYLAAYPQPQTAERLNELKTEYALMEDYWRRGVNDPQQAQLYQYLLQRCYVLYANVAAYYHRIPRCRASTATCGCSGRNGRSGTSARNWKTS